MFSGMLNCRRQRVPERVMLVLPVTTGISTFGSRPHCALMEPLLLLKAKLTASDGMFPKPEPFSSIGALSAQSV